MASLPGWPTTGRVLLVSSVACAAIYNGAARGQSGTVFMTAAIGSNFDNKLVRFDNGVQTFAVDTNLGVHSAFQGVTILNNEVLVADFGSASNAIQRFSLNGDYLGVFASIVVPTYLESDSHGNVYTTHLNLGPDV